MKSSKTYVSKAQGFLVQSLTGLRFNINKVTRNKIQLKFPGKAFGLQK